MAGGIHFEYEKVESCLQSIERHIKSISGILDEEFKVTSLQGETVERIENAVAKLKEGLKEIEIPLGKMTESINAARQNYIAKEQKIQSGLNGTGQGRYNANRTDIIK